MKEGLIKDAYELVIKEIQTIVTISYIVSVGIGMLFNFQKFSEFGINIFNYADVFDFLIAPFSDFYILLFASISILFASIIFTLDSFSKRKWPKYYSTINFGLDRKNWFQLYRTILFATVFVIYLFYSADFYGKYTKEKIINQGDILLRFDDNEIKKGKLIGKTKDVLFLLKDNNVFAIPITSLVKEIQIK